MISVRDLLTLSAGGGCWRHWLSWLHIKEGWSPRFIRPTHTHTHPETCAADIRDGGKVIKGKMVCIGFVLRVRRRRFCTNASVNMFKFFHHVFLLLVTQMHRCFSFICVSLIFCATLSDSIGVVIAVSTVQQLLAFILVPVINVRAFRIEVHLNFFFVLFFYSKW